jgi:hypothetical protein
VFFSSEGTLVADGPRIVSLANGVVTDLGVPTGHPILAIGQRTLPNHTTSSIVAIDSSGAILQRSTPDPLFKKIGEVPAAKRTSYSSELPNVGLSLAGTEMWITWERTLSRDEGETAWQLAPVKLPGFTDDAMDPSEASVEKARARNAKHALVHMRGPGDGFIAYYEPYFHGPMTDKPPAMNRAVSRLYRWDHGLATELAGIEDVEIEALAPDGDADAFIAAAEKRDNGETTVHFVAHVHEGNVQRIFESRSPVLALSQNDGEACFVVASGERTVAWHVTQEKKDSPYVQHLDVGGEATQARCVGHRRLSVAAASYVTDFDGRRVVTARFDEPRRSLGYVYGIFAESDDALQIFTGSGVFRMRAGALDQIADLPYAAGPFVAPDGTVFVEAAHKSLRRWQGTEWIEDRHLGHDDNIIFATSRDGYCNTELTFSTSKLFVNGTRVPGWAEEMHAEAGFGTASDAWLGVRSYVVGQTGIFHWDGKSLARVRELGDEVGARDIFGSANDDVYALVDGNVLHHFDGHAWTRGPRLPHGDRGITAGRGHAFVVGSDMLYEVDGSDVREMPLPANYTYTRPKLTARGNKVWVLAGDTVFRVAD